MLAEFTFDLDGFNWQTWLVPLAGAGPAVLILLLGRVALRKRRPKVPLTNFTAPERDPFDYGSHSERRKSVRRVGKPIKVHLNYVNGEGKPFEGWITDRSIGGFGIMTYHPVEENSRLSVLVVDAPPMTPCVHVEVLRATADGSRWQLGCQYVNSPSWGVILLFG
jgi:hypothetical protein